MSGQRSWVARRATPTAVGWIAIALAITLAAAGCGSSSAANHVGEPAPPTSAATGNGPTTAQLTEARRLIDPDHEPTNPTPAEVECVARIVVQDPNVDELANDMAQVQNPDLRQLVLTDYLLCAYNYVLNLYMRFAPAGLSKPQKACIRGKFTQLEVGRLAEVMVLDPDAGYTGPLVIALCKSGSKANPLLHGTIPSMGGS